MNKAKVLVSIINWNNSAATNACLQSIATIQKDNQPDVYLIDNNSQIDPLVLDKDLTSKLKSFALFNNDTNDGFAGGHNKAIIHAQKNDYDYICLLNNDAVLLGDDVFSQLTHALSNDETAVAAAPTIVSSTNPDVIWFAGGTMNAKKNFVTHNYVGQNISILKELNDVTSCTFLTGCCLMIALNRYPKLPKTLDEQYFLYWEDADWCAKALQTNSRLLYVKNAKVLHATSSSLGIRSASYAYYNIRNHILFARKWSRVSLAIAQCLWVGFKITGLSLKKPATTPKVFWYVLRGLGDGIRANTGALA